MKKRIATVKRETKETNINIELNLDGTGIASLDTGLPFLEHMLEQVAKHGMFDLKIKAKQKGLWNLFLPKDYNKLSPGLSNLEYAPLAEIMGRIPFSSEIFNCSAPDTGNMEVIAKYGSEAQKNTWLNPLMQGKIRSAFLMTEPDVASSDATNIETSIEK